MKESELYSFLQTLIVDIVTQVKTSSVSNLSCFLSQLLISSYAIQASGLSYFSFFLSNIKKFVFQFPFFIDHQKVDNVFFTKDPKEVHFGSLSVYRRLRDYNKNQLCKSFCQIEIKLTHCIHISEQQANKLRLSESWRTDVWSRVSGSRVLTASLPSCLLSKASLYTMYLPLKHQFYKFGDMLDFEIQCQCF